MKIHLPIILRTALLSACMIIGAGSYTMAAPDGIESGPGPKPDSIDIPAGNTFTITSDVPTVDSDITLAGTRLARLQAFSGLVLQVSVSVSSRFLRDFHPSSHIASVVQRTPEEHSTPPAFII